MLYKEVYDEKTINKLVYDYEYVIKIIINKYRINSKDYDDALQEGRLGLLKAINAYEDGKGSNFNSFASLCIERQILSFLRNQGRKKNKIHNYSFSLDTINQESESKLNYIKSDVEEYILSKIHYKDIYDLAINKLTGIEKNIFRDYVLGFSVSELSEKYDIPKKQLYVIIAKAKKKIEELLKR